MNTKKLDWCHHFSFNLNSTKITDDILDTQRTLLQPSTTDTLQDEPSCFNLENRGQFLQIEKDRLTIRYIGPGTQQQDAGVCYI